MDVNNHKDMLVRSQENYDLSVQIFNSGSNMAGAMNRLYYSLYQLMLCVLEEEVGKILAMTKKEAAHKRIRMINHDECRNEIQACIEQKINFKTANNVGKLIKDVHESRKLADYYCYPITADIYSKSHGKVVNVISNLTKYKAGTSIQIKQTL